MKYTIKEIKAELEAYRNNEKNIEAKLAEIEEERAKALKTTSTISDMPKGSNPVQDRIAEYIVKILELQEKNYKYVLEQKQKQERIKQTIDSLNQPSKNILYFRYIKGVELKEVTSYLDKDYEYKWLCVLHGRALEQYRKVKEENDE